MGWLSDLKQSVGIGTSKKPPSVARKRGGGSSRTNARSGAKAFETLKVNAIENLPSHKALLSVTGGVFELPERLQAQLGVLQIEQRKCYLLTSEDLHGSNSFFALQDRVLAQSYSIEKVLLVNSGLLVALCESVKKRDGSERSENSEIGRDLDRLLRLALSKNISDIHIEKRDGSADVRVRMDGKLHFHEKWHAPYALQFARALHNFADADSKSTTFSESESQQMSVTRLIDGSKKVKLRVQTVPAYPDGGFDVIARVLVVGANSAARPLSGLGYEESHVKMLDYMLSLPNGLIILAGITGSGKSTTLQTMMSNIKIENPDLKLYSIEDPPEYIMNGVTQIPVVRKLSGGKNDSNPFAASMRDVMRADPDIVMVGEVRDSESSSCLVSMVNSGHKVLTTIHASSAFDIFGRLEKFGIDRSTMASENFIAGLMYQTLVPMLCPECKVPYRTDMKLAKAGLHERIAKTTFPSDTLFFASPDGCENCDYTGIKGRSVCAEVVTLTPQMKQAIAEGYVNAAAQQWRATRKYVGESIRDVQMAGCDALTHGILKMRQGLVAPDDIEASMGPLTGKIDDSGDF